MVLSASTDLPFCPFSFTSGSSPITCRYFAKINTRKKNQPRRAGFVGYYAISILHKVFVESVSKLFRA
jgi:hypothetical protein